MDCGKVENLLPHLDDGEMDENTVAAVRAHLEHCDNCRLKYDEQRRVLSLFDRVYSDETTETGRDFIDGVTARIEHRRTVRRSLHRYAVAAVIVMAVGSAALIKLNPFTGGVPDLEVASELDHPELDTYVATQYMDTSDLQTMIASSETDTEEEIIESMIAGRVVDLTAEDIIMTLDDTELALMYASIE